MAAKSALAGAEINAHLAREAVVDLDTRYGLDRLLDRVHVLEKRLVVVTNKGWLMRLDCRPDLLECRRASSMLVDMIANVARMRIDGMLTLPTHKNTQ